MNPSGLAGVKVLVVEESALIALDLAEVLAEMGCAVLGPAGSPAEALALLKGGRPDAALVELRPGDGEAGVLVDRLRALGVPFALATGHDEPGDHDPALAGVPCLPKPYGRGEVAGMVRRLLLGRKAPAA